MNSGVTIEGLQGCSRVLPEERCAVLECIPESGAVLEIGTLHGVTVASWAIARPGVQFVSVDPFVDRKFGEDARQHWEANRQPNMTLVVGTIDDLKWTQRFGVIFVDGDHTAAGCYHDLVATRDRVAPHGHLIVHDVINHKCAGVKRAVRRFCRDFSYRCIRILKTLAWLEKA